MVCPRSLLVWLKPVVVDIKFPAFVPWIDSPSLSVQFHWIIWTSYYVSHCFLHEKSHGPSLNPMVHLHENPLVHLIVLSHGPSPWNPIGPSHKMWNDFGWYWIPSGNLTELLKMAIFHGKIHYKWPFSIATLNYQRVSLSESHEETSHFHHLFKLRPSHQSTMNIWVKQK